MTAASAPLLLDPEAHELRPASAARALGRVLVLAPHADDESLGCGGLLAILARAGLPAHVAVVTDGTKSHPNSALYPPGRLCALREAEARRAVRHLGHGGRVSFLRYPDSGLPDAGTDAFEAAARRLGRLLDSLRPDTLLVPWRRDPHCDHEAVWRLAAAARRPGVRWIEYPVWAWTRADDPAVAPHADEATAWRLDIASVLDAKARAVAAHRSQTSDLIADDPGGFRLAPHVLAHFERPWELFIEPHDADPSGA